jgi:shikimate dehydrogenase
VTRSLLLGLIGAGIGPSLTPQLHEAEAAVHGLRCIYRLLDLDVLGGGSGITASADRMLRSFAQLAQTELSAPD